VKDKKQRWPVVREFKPDDRQLDALRTVEACDQMIARLEMDLQHTREFRQLVIDRSIRPKTK